MILLLGRVFVDNQFDNHFIDLKSPIVLHRRQRETHVHVKRTHKACKACYVVLKIVLSLSLKTGLDLSPINCAG